MKPRGPQPPYTSGISDIWFYKPGWIPQSRAGAVNTKHHVVAWKLPEVKSKELVYCLSSEAPGTARKYMKTAERGHPTETQTVRTSDQATNAIASFEI